MVIQWEKVSIGSSFEFKNGLNKGKEFFGQGTPIVNYTDVYKKRGLYKRDIQGKVTLTPEEIKRFKVEKNDVFFTRTSETPDEVGFSSVLLEEIENCVFSGFVLRAHPKNEEFYPLYCKYCFSTPDIREAISKTCTYTTRALTNGRQLSAIEILLPPLPEQQRIAEALSDVDALISSLEKLIAKKKAIKQGTMQELLTGKRRLPGFNKAWKECRLSDLGRFMKGSGISRAEAASGKLPAVRYGELYTVHEFYIKKYESQISVEASEKALPLSYGDILFAASGETKEEIGKCAAIIDRYTVYAGGDIIVLRPSVQLNPIFMGTLLNSTAICKQKAERGQGDAIVHIHSDSLGSISVPIPDIEEQNAIAIIFYDMDCEINDIEQKLAKYRQVKQGMMQELLTGRIRL